MGCDTGVASNIPETDIFLLTHPVWDVTQENEGEGYSYYISTHTSRVGCDEAKNYIKSHVDISTHTSRVGCDLCNLLHNA